MENQMKELNEIPAYDENDEIRAENALLKLKLDVDHKMEMSDFSGIDPVTENRFLTQVLSFEQHYQNAGTIRLYDFLEQPAFRRLDELADEEIGEELDRLRNIMEGKSIVLDCIESYPDWVIYKFITEELFIHEVDNFSIEGMVRHFIYEEFHPGHS
jgi:hypothetical protein